MGYVQHLNRKYCKEGYALATVVRRISNAAAI